MILEHVKALNTQRIVLASQSPRRREILGNFGLKFEVIPPTFEEDLDKSKFANGGEYACETAMHKAIEVAEKTSKDEVPAALVIASDTVVECDGHVMEKPDDAEHAYKMLRQLSGGSHAVYTGVALVLPLVDGPEAFRLAFYETTEVEFDELSDAEIQAYIESGEPYGKAGSYGIQGKAGSFVKQLKGCYFNVMGFPLHRFTRELKAIVDKGLLAEGK